MPSSGAVSKVFNRWRASGYKPVYPWLSPGALAILNHAADARGEHPCQLAAKLLERVLDDKLIDAVLD